jgi:hypothetical protein
MEDMAAREEDSFLSHTEIGDTDAARRQFKLSIFTSFALVLCDRDMRQILFCLLSHWPIRMRVLLRLP